MDRPRTENRSHAGEELPTGVTAMAVALVVTSFALLLAPLFA